MAPDWLPFSELLSEIVDNRGKTCPTCETGTPLIATNCVRNDLLYPAFEKVRFVSQETYDTWFRGHPKPGDLVFVTKGTPGRVCMAPAPIGFCIAQDMVSIRADERKVYPKFLFALLRSRDVQVGIEQMHVGTLIPHFKKGDFNKLLLPIPDRRTQLFIGDVYFDFCAKIELNRRMNETLEGMARAIFKSWFVDFDPVRAKAEGRDPNLPKPIADLFPDSFEDSELGKIPKGWQVGPLTEIATLATTTVHPAERPETLWEHYSIPAFDEGRRPKWERGEAIKSGKYTVPSECVLASKLNPQFPRVWLPGVRDPDVAVCSTEFMPFVPQVTTWRPFLFELASSESFQSEILSRITGSTGSRQRVQPRQIAVVPVVVPPRAVIEAFSTTVGPLQERRLKSIRESSTLAALRDALLPKLLSGEIRVGDAGKIREGAP